MNNGLPFEAFIIIVLIALVIGFILGHSYFGRTLKHLAYKIVEVMNEKVAEETNYITPDEITGQMDISEL
jgi:hypothetical protein